jgi:hypothetical protein
MMNKEPARDVALFVPRDNYADQAVRSFVSLLVYSLVCPGALPPIGTKNNPKVSSLAANPIVQP